MRPFTLSTSDASGGAKSSLPGPLDIYNKDFQVTLQAIVTGTVNYDLQYTKDDIWASTFNVATAQWTSFTAATNATANAEATLISPVSAVRILQNSGSGSVACRVIQSGGP